MADTKHSFKLTPIGNSDWTVTGAGTSTKKMTLATAGKFVDRDIEIESTATVPASTVSVSGKTVSYTAGWVDAGRQDVASGELSVNDNEVSVSTAGYLVQGTKKTVADGGLANTATSGVTYSAVDAPVLNADANGDYYLYVNKGWQGNKKINLGTLIPDDADRPNATAAYIREGYEAFSPSGKKLVGTIKDVTPTFTGGAISGSVTDITGSNITVGTTDTYSTGIKVSASASAGRAAVTYNGNYSGYIDKASGNTALAATSSNTALTGRDEYVTGITIASGKTFGNTTTNAINVAGTAYVGDSGTVNIKFPTAGSGSVNIAGTTVASSGALTTTSRTAGSTTLNLTAGDGVATLAAGTGDSASNTNTGLALLDTAPTSGTYYTVTSTGKGSVSGSAQGSVSTGMGWITEGSTNSTQATGSKTSNTATVNKYIPKASVSTNVSGTNPTVTVTKTANGFTASSTATDYYVEVGGSSNSQTFTSKYTNTVGYTPANSTAVNGGTKSVSASVTGTGKVYIPAGSKAASVSSHTVTAGTAKAGTSVAISDATNYATTGITTTQPTSGVYLTIAPTISKTDGSASAVAKATVGTAGYMPADSTGVTSGTSTKSVGVTTSIENTRYIPVYEGTFSIA